MKIELLGGKNEQKRQLPQVTHPQRLEMNFEENETAKSYFSCSLVSGSLCSRSGFFRFSSSHQGTLETPNGRRTHTTRLDHANLGKIASTVREDPGDEVGTPWRLRAYRSRSGASRPPGGSIRGARCEVAVSAG